MNLGWIYKDLGNLDQALASTLKSLELKPDNPDAHINLGGIYRDLGNLDQALASTLKSLELKPDNPDALCNLGNIYRDLGNLNEAKKSVLKALNINPNHFSSAWNLYGLASNAVEAEKSINLCLSIDTKDPKPKIILAALRYHQGDSTLLENISQSQYKQHPYARSIKWVSDLPNTPLLFFNRWDFFDHMVDISIPSRPFYEFGVWNGASFRYLTKSLKRGFGFDTFEGLPERWHNEKEGKYSAFGVIPQVEGGIFVKGKFEETLPTFFSKQQPIASIINFDADLYSSTLCALENCKTVIDSHTILIFDELIINKHWEEDEYKALSEFCAKHSLTYDVIAVSYFTKQVAVKLLEQDREH
ncbi:photosystem I assembly protein Ycf3 [Prochlorococcus sp. MIT 1303]|nr:photosystem I assembly protein Ycf3 [Prochlorococcus sp. MIT 1303]